MLEASAGSIMGPLFFLALVALLIITAVMKSIEWIQNAREVDKKRHRPGKRKTGKNDFNKRSHEISDTDAMGSLNYDAHLENICSLHDIANCPLCDPKDQNESDDDRDLNSLT